MAMALAAVLALPVATRAEDVPYYNRETRQDQDMGGVNQNFRSLSDRGRDNTTQHTSCTAGAYFLNGQCLTSQTDAGVHSEPQTFGSSMTVTGGLFGATDNSAFATLTSSQSTTSTSWVAVVGTTVTITGTGSRICAEYRCVLTDTASGGNSCIGGILFNGAYQDSMSDSLGYTSAEDPAGAIAQSGGPWKHCATTRYASGTSVSAVAVMRSQGGGESCAVNYGLRSSCQMHIWELR